MRELSFLFCPMLVINLLVYWFRFIFKAPFFTSYFVINTLNRKVLKQIKGLTPGDLVFVSWFDPSIGKSLSEGFASIDVPVSSWDIFIGLLGQKKKHLILAQNNFHYADGLYDIDYTAIPLSWTASVTIIEKHHVGSEEAQSLASSFLMGGRRRRVPKRKRQQKVVNHERPA